MERGPEDHASETLMTPASSRTTTTKTPPRWGVRVTYPSGDEAWLRHGGTIGEGSIVRFRSKRLAELNVEFVREGLDQGTTVTVVKL
jgi:hypothetical protein